MPKRNAVEAFTMHLGLALHRYGTPAHTLEAALSQIAQRFGVPAHFLSTPTSITASFGIGDDQRVYLERVPMGDIDLGKLSLVDELTTQVIQGEVDPQAAYVLIDTIMGSGPNYGPLAIVLAYGGASGAVARLFGGGWLEALVATFLGLAIGGLALLSQRVSAFGRVFELGAAAVSAWLAALAYYVFTCNAVGTFSVQTAILAGLIVLVPGLTFTTAMTELSTGNLVSGTARLMGAGMTFLKLGFGVALGTRLGAYLFTPGTGNAIVAPAWTQWPALALAAVSLMVILQAPFNKVGWIVGMSLLGYASALYGSLALGPELGAFAASFAVTFASKAYAYLSKRTPTVVQVPAILLLVPGSVGYRALSDIMERDVIAGMQTAFSMIFTAMALVVGTLLAGLLFRDRS